MNTYINLFFDLVEVSLQLKFKNRPTNNSLINL